ncbi:MAG: V4R domain-containing protein [Candidatus Heimdallarchaeota archaeon]
MSKKIESLFVIPFIPRIILNYYYLAGYFVGRLEEIVGKQLTCEEISCIAKNDPTCMFKIESGDE